MQAGRRVDAVRDLSLELGSGDFVGILGRSRSGKTTALRLAAGLEASDSGVITYQGRQLDKMSRGELSFYRRREVRSIFGLSSLNPGLRVIDNVSLPLLIDGVNHYQAEQRARDQLVAVEAVHCAYARPLELSAGECQRVTVAQALVTKPKLLLADEPASNLDPIEQDALLALFQSLVRDEKMAVLIADTEATALMRTRPMLYLRDGQLIADSPAREVAEVVDFKKHRKEAS